MSANDNIIADLNVNTSNSNKTDSGEINAVITRIDDASSNPGSDDVEEMCLGDTTTMDQSQPDVYTPPGEDKSVSNSDSVTGESMETDKWALPSTKRNEKSNDIDKETNNSSKQNEVSGNEELKVELPPLKKDTSEMSDSKNDSQMSDTKYSDLSKFQSSESEISNSETMSVKLPPLEGDRTESEKNNGATLQDSLKPETTDCENERSQSPMDDKSSCGSLEGVYQIKWAKFKGKEVPIITQNENGPCPLLAIMNVLLLKGKIKFSSDTEIISSEQMMAHLGECIFANKPQNATEVVQLNYEQNMQDAMAVIHKLQTGLDVNVRFNSVSEFEYTPECIIFDLLGISLYHGWLVDPQNQSEVTAIGNCSYNQLVEKIISQRSSENHQLVTEALVAEGFLDRTASQLTYHGLCELSSTLKPDQLCVFFRNNHFCTLYRQKDELFLLVTDQGFLHERNVVWETLNNVEGDHYFVDSEFHTYTKPTPQEPVLPPDVSVNSDEQVNHDFLLAMSLQQEQQLCAEQMEVAEAPQQQPQHQRTHLSDAEFAARLQAEEDAQAAQQAAQPPAQPHGNQRVPPGGNQQRSRDRERPRDRERHRERSREKDSSCCIL
ncbi:ubiquitin carboxyl-terminal hydrolase MINDY-1-like isoform X1 [Mytilus edulis]|uniref:ubiquitin carboxyl-terminal hydrolase MINDY-1-like isoform X1 n=2 Tax=Mytilus edulis TaxID=6550 RepID=UPI0039EE702E